jgi:DNA-directed RNA polymerase subunit RPC12/RpoP
MKTRTVLRCPQCGSLDLYIENGLVTGYIYHCKNCDYVGPLVFEEDLDEDELAGKKGG